MKLKTLALALLAAMALPAAAAEISGKFAAEGTNLDGSTYSGTATITMTSDTTCAIKWETEANSSDGICQRNGDVFSAAFVVDGDVGLSIYKVSGDGSLQGTWTIAGEQGSGTEKLVPAN